MFGWFKKKPKSLEEVIFETKSVTIHGVPLTLKKVNVLNYLDGSKVMMQQYDVYKSPIAKKPLDISDKKLNDHMRDVLMAGVLSPKLTRKKGEEGFYVDDLFEHTDFAHAVYMKILEFTYGKKKVRPFLSRVRS